MIRSVRRRSALATAVVAAVVAAAPAQALAVPVPNSCAKGNFSEWHDGYPTFFSFKRAYSVRSTPTTATIYHEYLVGYYTLRGPVPFGAVRKVCGRERT